MSKTCGNNLGDLHADFLLSFVPNVCMSDKSDDLQQRKGHVGDHQKKADRRISELLNNVGRNGDFQKDEGPKGNRHKGESSVDDNLKDEGHISDLENRKGYPGDGDSVKGSSQDEEVIPEAVRPQKRANPEQASATRDSGVYEQVSFMLFVDWIKSVIWY